MSVEVKVTVIIVFGILLLFGGLITGDQFGRRMKHASYQACIQKYPPAECAQSLKE